jgi:hypothetical protein
MARGGPQRHEKQTYLYVYIRSEWNTDGMKGVQITTNKDFKTLLLADNQVIVAKSETLLQRSVH